jgi:transcriptional regulator of acetoin/glycerol metabolism
MGDAPVVRFEDLTGLGGASPRPIIGPTRPLPGSGEERDALLEALASTQENITLTAQELGVSRVTLYRMLRRHSISLSRGLKAPPVAS